MANRLQEIGHNAGALMSMLKAIAPSNAQDCAHDFAGLASELAAAIATHLNCEAGRGRYNDMEILAPLRPKGSRYDESVDLFLDDILCIAYETGLPNTADYAQRYLDIVNTAASVIAKTKGIALVATADTYDSIYMPFAVFGPAHDGQDPPLGWGDQTGDKWTHARAYIDRATVDHAEISENRRQTIEYYRYSPIWTIIESKLPPCEK
jgi:hypothetical protein